MHAVTGRELHQRGLAGAERHREHGHQIVVDAEAAGVLGDQRHAEVLGETHGHQVARELDAGPQRRGAVELAGVVFRLPGLLAGPWSISIGASRITRGRRVAVVEGGGIDERLEGEPGWRLAWVARSNWLSANENPPTTASTRPVCGSMMMMRALDLRHLHHLPLAVDQLAVLVGPTGRRRTRRRRRTAGQFLALLRQPATARLQPAPAPRCALLRACRSAAWPAASRSAVLRCRPPAPPPAATVRCRDSAGILPSSVPQSLAQFDFLDRSAPAAPAIEPHQPVDQRLLGITLIGWVERGAHRQTAAVQLVLAVLVDQCAAHLLGKILGGEDVRAELTDLTPSGCSLASLASASVMYLYFSISPMIKLRRKIASFSCLNGW